ncbi:MAG: hypothetical protein PHE96_12445 [Methylococcales bacterium]|nr:hypothetical protein [Methylococcales bacterium]
MSDKRINVPMQPELPQLHAATCLLMTQFINGRHCPKLAHLIVQQLSSLLAHPELEQFPDSRNMYQQLLEHWQKVTALLLEQQAVGQRQSQYH